MSANEWHFVDETAAANERTWHVSPAIGGGILVRGYSDDASQHDDLVLRRRGVFVRTKVPELADLREIPELMLVEPLIRVRRRLYALGFQDELPPMLINTATASKIWPIFKGTLGNCPIAGAASVLGILLVWSPALNLYVAEK